MNHINNERQKARLQWVKLYEEIKDAGIVCRRCGISRPTLRKWLKRYAEKGLAGLKSTAVNHLIALREKCFFSKKPSFLNYVGIVS